MSVNGTGMKINNGTSIDGGSMRQIIAALVTVLFVLPLCAEDYEYWVPAAAFGESNSGTYETEVVLVQSEPNCSEDTCTGTDVKITLVPFGQHLVEGNPQSVVVPRNGLAIYPVRHMPEIYPVSGYIHVSADSPLDISAIVNRFGDGILQGSQTVPTISNEMRPEKVVIPNVAVDNEGNEEVTTNVFLLNMDVVTISFEVRFQLGYLLPFSTHHVEVGPKSAMALNNVDLRCYESETDPNTGITGTFEVPQCIGYFEITTSTAGRWYVFASRINRVSGDSTTLLPSIH